MGEENGRGNEDKRRKSGEGKAGERRGVQKGKGRIMMKGKIRKDLALCQ